MKLLRIIAMPTNHNFHGNPTEISRVELWVSEDVKLTPSMVAVLKENQDMKLHSLVKAMPHGYWNRESYDHPPRANERP